MLLISAKVKAGVEAGTDLAERLIIDYKKDAAARSGRTPVYDGRWVYGLPFGDMLHPAAPIALEPGDIVAVHAEYGDVLSVERGGQAVWTNDDLTQAAHRPSVPVDIPAPPRRRRPLAASRQPGGP